MIELKICDIEVEMERLIRSKKSFYALDEEFVEKGVDVFKKLAYLPEETEGALVLILKNTNMYFHSLFELAMFVYQHSFNKLIILTDLSNIILDHLIFQRLLEEPDLKIRFLGRKIDTRSMSYNDAYFYLQVLIQMRNEQGKVNR